MNRAFAQAAVLNVDDNEIGRYTKTKILQQAGFAVIEASNGIEALSIVREQRPQLVLLDLQLPDMNGFEICRRIRSDPATARTPVLHITATARSFEDAEATSVESGGDILLTQPIEPQELVTVVRTLLRLRATEIGLAESEERMRLATEGAGIATWEVDLRDGTAHLSAQLYRLLGYAPDEVPPTWDVWRERIHPGDRRGVLEAIERARRSGELFTHEHRILRRDDGAERWLAPYGRIHGDHRGEPARFIGIVVDITARKRAEAGREELLRLEHAARREAEDLARLKDEFLATLSHELRSPMSAILGWLHLLRSGRLTDEQRATAIETIERNAQLQNQLIKDLLDISSVIAGKLDLKREPVMISDVIERAVQSVRLSAEAQHIAISTELENVGPHYYDAARMQQVFVNLLSNAIKFTPSGGRIDVIGARRGDWLDVDVRDTGEGIARKCCRTCSSASGRRMARLRAGTAVSASDSRSCATSFICTAAAYRPRARARARAPRSPCACRSPRCRRAYRPARGAPQAPERRECSGAMP
jgi:PAS domain S-box-containing protein